MARKSLAGGSVSKHLFVVLVATRNPLNIGAAARAMQLRICEFAGGKSH